MKQFSFQNMKRGMVAAVLAVAGILTVMAQDDDISTLVNSISDPQVVVDNDGVLPWYITNGNEIRCGNYGKTKSSSTLTLTFTSEKETRLDFERYFYSYSNDWHFLEFYIDGERKFLYSNGGTYDWSHSRYYMEAGSHVIQFRDSIGSSITNSPRSHLRNISIRDFDWVDVTLSQAGTLASEVLYAIGELSGILDDVIQLRIHGPLNNDDWAKIRQMHNLRDIDLTDVQISEIPNSAFSGLSYLRNILLPEGITRIGNNAFENRPLTRIHIPTAVKEIGQMAFKNSSVQEVTFAEDSQLETIGHQAFFRCQSLKAFEMPATVSTVSSAAFMNCYNMTTLHFSDAVKTIEANTCYGMNSLNNLHLPANLIRIWGLAFYNTSALRHVDFPEGLDNIHYRAFYNSGLDSVCLPRSVQYLGERAFENCKYLKYVELPIYLYDGYFYYTCFYGEGATSSSSNFYHGYRNNFNSCPNIHTVVCPSTTPPSIVNHIFEGGPAKANITVKVPKFSVVDYKQHSYWQGFNIVPGDATDYLLVTSRLSLTNNRRPDGQADIDIWSSGSLTVGGNSPMPIGQLNISKGGQLLSQCDNITADGISTVWNLEGGKWYYFTPMYDINLTDVGVTGDALYVFRYYDGAARALSGKNKTENWKDVNDGMLHAGQGYIVQASKATTLTLPATATGSSQLFRNADVTMPLQTHATDQTANRSWNFVGNPFATYYDIQRMDFDAPVIYWNGSKYDYKRPGDDAFALEPMQAFFVQKPDGVEIITFHKEGRQLTNEVSQPAAARGNSDRRLFDLQLTTADGQEDHTRVVINQQSSTVYELQCDAAKFITDGCPMLYTLDADGTACAINERPLADGRVPLCIAAESNSPQQMVLSTICAADDIWITDHETGQTVNLREQAYTFTLYGSANDRFTLTFGTDPTAINEIVNSKSSNSEWFDLQGRHLNGQPRPGLYIQNGRKHVVR